MSLDIFHISLYTVGLVICLTCLLFTFVQKRYKKEQNKLYIALVLILASNALAQIGCEFCAPYRTTSSAAFAITAVLEMLYFLLHATMSPVFCIYALSICGAYSSGQNKKTQIKYGWPFVVSELLILTNPITHWVYRFNENRQFVRGWAESIVYFSAAFYILFSMWKLFFTWNALTQKRRLALIYFFGIVLTGIVIQLLYIDIKSELFAEALAMLGIMIAIETEDDRIDVDTGIYNRKALSSDLNAMLINKRRFTVICIKITNGDIIQRASGSENHDIISAQLHNDFVKIAPDCDLYSTSSFTYLILMPETTEEEAYSYAQAISDRFKQPWKLRDMDILLNAVVMTAESPGRIKSSNDVFYMADSPVPTAVDKDVLKGSDLDYLMRRLAVEGAISRGLDLQHFEVYYQPTYYLNDKKLHGAEALIRLHDNVLGNLFPDEFIPIAEQIGLISNIDEFVLREVCAFIKTGIPAKFGMECINVNLSVTECMQPGFIDRINRIAEEFGIDKHSLNFEITESINADDYERLSKVVHELKSAGFQFSMDDYGTGYSNMRSIFSLDFDVIKIDKSILWSAEESELGKIILENSVRMIRQMKREILVEGVETEQQIALLTKLSVDYLQGYYFSKPIPKSDFIELIEHQKHA